jgi:hypothetical protein
MIALIFFVLAALASPFKSKRRLEAENAALRHQLIILRRKIKGPGPADERRSLVLRPALSLVPVGPAGPHYRCLAPGRLADRGLRDRCGGVKEQRPAPVANLMRWGIRLRRRHCSDVRSAIRLKPCCEALAKGNQAKDPHNERMAGHQHRT